MHFYWVTHIIRRAVLINVRSEQARDCKGSKGILILGEKRKEEIKKISSTITKIIVKNETAL